MKLTPAQIREVHSLIVQQDPEFLKALAVEIIRDGIDVSEDMAQDLSDEEVRVYKPTVENIKQIGLSCIADQLATLADDIEKAVMEMPLTFQQEMKVEFKKVQIG